MKTSNQDMHDMIFEDIILQHSNKYEFIKRDGSKYLFAQDHKNDKNVRSLTYFEMLEIITNNKYVPLYSHSPEGLFEGIAEEMNLQPPMLYIGI